MDEQAAAGWYPQADGSQRWWTGTEWLEGDAGIMWSQAPAAPVAQLPPGAGHPMWSQVDGWTLTPTGWVMDSVLAVKREEAENLYVSAWNWSLIGILVCGLVLAPIGLYRYSQYKAAWWNVSPEPPKTGALVMGIIVTIVYGLLAVWSLLAIAGGGSNG